jgi:phage shock protein PspC (stress-responsive transcriptional regulator)
MEKTTVIGLTGHAEQFRLDEDAYGRLERYLDRAAARLHDDPDRAEVIGDLERSIGDKLVARLGADDRLVTAADIDAVLEQIGTVDTGRDAGTDERSPRPRGRRLVRIREGQEFAGVCTGLAAYSEIDVAWVRTIFVFATLVTAGLFLVVYIALAFILPVTPTREQYYAERR